MLQVTVNRRHLMVFAAVIALVVSVAWVGVAQRASAGSATPVVYVATGENFPDALGASAAAAVQGGPVLLVTKTSIPAETKDELNRLKPDVIYVAGGTMVVSDTVFNQLKAYAGSVVRVAGGNRYATAAEVSKSAFPVTGGGSAALEARVAALEAEVDALQATLSGVSRNGTTLMFTGMNLQVVNGEGRTDSKNSLGNVIIGYNEKPPSPPSGYRAGSHYLVTGVGNAYSAFAGFVAGFGNTASGPYASVSGGESNTAGGYCSSVSGGGFNTASDYYSSVSGGGGSEASESYSSVSGGNSNTASGYYSSVSGGDSNTASGYYSSVSGGYGNDANPSYSSILGGASETLTGSYSHYPN